MIVELAGVSTVLDEGVAVVGELDELAVGMGDDDLTLAGCGVSTVALSRFGGERVDAAGFKFSVNFGFLT